MSGHSEIMEQKKMILEIQKAKDDIGEEKITEFFNGHENLKISTEMPLGERLELMRDDIGDEMFDKIAKGDSLMPTLDRWIYEKMEAHMERLVEKTHNFFVDSDHAEITKEHIYFLFTAMSIYDE